MPYVITLDQMEAVTDELGQAGHVMEGHKHGFDSTTIIRTEIAPGGGPPPHAHAVEEAHALSACRMAYTIGDEQFEVEGPCLVRLPAHVPHTCTNIGDTPITLICFWPSPNFWTTFEEIGPNPRPDSPCRAVARRRREATRRVSAHNDRPSARGPRPAPRLLSAND